MKLASILLYFFIANIAAAGPVTNWNASCTSGIQNYFTHACLVEGGGGGAVTSFNSRVGAIIPQFIDYSAFFDSLGAAATAQAYAIQRSNQTGTQTASTISDFNTTARGLFSATSPMTYNSGTGAFGIPIFTGDTGTGGAVGVVPSPSPTTGEQGYVLGADGSFDPNDTSKPIYSSFNLLSQTLPPSGNQKFQNTLMIQNGLSTYAIAGGGTNKTISIYNVTDQNNPKLRGSINLSGTYGACGDKTSWPYIFVPASGARTLTVLNISDPNNPTIVGTPFSWAANTTSIYGCSYSNGLVFMAGQSHGLGILDVGNGVSGGTITAPVLAYDEGTQSICSVANSCKSFGVAVDPTIQVVYSLDFSTATPWTYRQLKAYYYGSSITSPTLYQNLTMPANTKTGGLSLNIGTHTAFVTDTNQNVYYVVDTTNVAAGGMSTVATITPSGASRVVPVAGTIASVSGSNFAYIPSGSASTPGQIEFYDLTTKSSPIKISQVTDGTALSSSNVFANIAIDPRGGYLYVSSYGNGTTGAALELFTLPLENATFGNSNSSQITIKNILQMPVQASGITPTCSTSADNGKVAFTNGYILCVCNGFSWVEPIIGLTTCTF